MSTSSHLEQAGPCAHDHLGCISQALATAERLCLERGVRLTPARKKVLELIWESHQAAKAYDLLDRIKAFEPAAKPTTIYRALDFLLAQGLIHRVESLNAYIGCVCSERQHEQLLLICERCREIDERPAPEVMSAVAREIAAAGFTVAHKAIEIHGRCAECAAAGSPGEDAVAFRDEASAPRSGAE